MIPKLQEYPCYYSYSSVNIDRDILCITKTFPMDIPKSKHRLYEVKT